MNDLIHYQTSNFQHAVPFEQQFIPCELQKKQAICNMEIQKAAALAEIRYQSDVRKEQLKEQVAEHRRQIYEQLVVTGDGELQFKTQNLSFDAKPRTICNAKFFRMTYLLDSENNTNYIVMVQFKIDGAEKFFYLDPNKMGKNRYVLQKMTTSGIQIKLPETKLNSFARQFIAWLLNHPIETRVVPHDIGWVQMTAETDSFIYINEEDTFTWTKIAQQL